MPEKYSEQLTIVANMWLWSDETPYIDYDNGQFTAGTTSSLRFQRTKRGYAFAVRLRYLQSILGW